MCQQLPTVVCLEFPLDSDHVKELDEFAVDEKILEANEELKVNTYNK